MHPRMRCVFLAVLLLEDNGNIDAETNAASGHQPVATLRITINTTQARGYWHCARGHQVPRYRTELVFCSSHITKRGNKLCSRLNARYRPIDHPKAEDADRIRPAWPVEEVVFPRFSPHRPLAHRGLVTGKLAPMECKGCSHHATRYESTGRTMWNKSHATRHLAQVVWFDRSNAL